MKVELFLPQVGEHITTENILYIAKEAEKKTLILCTVYCGRLNMTTHGASPDGSLPVKYQNVLDPLTTLIYVASVTERISLGTRY